MPFSLSGLLTGTGRTPTNAYTAPNLDFLRDNRQPNYDFLRRYAGQIPQTLTGNYKTYLDYLNPSSVDNPALQSTLADIKRTNNQNLGTSMMDSYTRGLVGDGSNSDIAANALAQVNEGGQRAVAGAYGQAYENAANLAARSAEGYNSANLSGTQLQGGALQNYASGLGSNATLDLQRRLGLGNLLNGQASDYAKYQQPGTYGMLGTFGSSFANEAGKGASAALF